MKNLNSHLAVVALIAYLQCLLLLLPQGTHSFPLPRHLPQQHSTERTSSLLRKSSDDNTSEEEDSLSEAERMELVRQLQKTFYQPTEESSIGTTTTTATITTKGLDPSTGIFHQLPLWRVGWVEVPGRANCLNVHEGHYTNMFETILAGPQPWYVGHLCLPGGTQAARTGATALQLKTWQQEAQDEERFDSATDRSAVVGCLMRITDYRRLEDGRLILLVHPLERFVVQNTIQQFPFAQADVQLLPDMDHYLSDDAGDENYSKLARAKAVRESFAYQEYEFSTTKLLPLPKDEEYLSTQSAFGSAIAQVLPFAFYADNDNTLESVKASDSSTKRDDNDVSLLGAPTPLEQTLINAGILHFPLSLTGGDEPTKDTTVLETLLWLELDDFCRVQQFTLPDEVLQLMPPNLADTLDMDAPPAFLSIKYPVHRRQQRLSYHIPALIEQTSYGKNMRQAWLNTPTTAARLRAVLQRFQVINEAHMGQFE